MSIRRPQAGQLLKLLAALAFAGAAAVGAVAPAQADRTQVPAPSRGGAKDVGANPSGGLYIVQLAGDPVVAYSGDVPGLQATRPAPGEKINPRSNNVVRYVDHLTARHNDALAAVGGGGKAYSYTYSYNGFAASLTADQAAKLAVQPGVLSVTPNEMQYLETSSTPDFLGLTEPGGLYDQLGGIGSAGEDVIIGIVDSGVWPENPAFSDRTGTNGNGSRDGNLGYRQIPGWHGRCVPGEQFTASNCNQKLIGARYYNAGFGGNAGIDATLPFEFNSPRDHNGHGSHTSSTAGGNANVATTGPASVFGPISGIAPRARIASYKACWSVPGTAGSCSGVDLLAAIDQAVADGVDVINYSISGTTTNFRDPVEIAFLFAADAGVFVAASAGNSGPAISTVAHPSPWITTVAAGTHNRNGSGSVTLGNGSTYAGASVATPVGPAPLINAADAGLAGADPAQVALCYSTADTGGAAVLDPAKVAGKIVVCDRGVTARVNKSLAVQAAGGVGMILVNTSASSLNADFHFVPTVHLAHTDRAAVQAYAVTPGATATINAATIGYNEPAPLTASFSSRGPLNAGGGDLLKPDVIAPGQDILAAVAPPNNAGRDFDLYSGTSMSSPHVAGLGALLTDLHPDWSPMAIKSALMTSAYDVLDGGTPAPNTNPVLIFRQGAGHVQPNSAANPGLVYDSNFNDWLAFICATQPQGLEATCEALWNAGFSRNPSDFNSPSIAIGDLVGTETVTRSVTNVSGGELTVTANVTGMTGMTAVVTPSSLTLAAGETQQFTVAITRTTAALNAYTGGQLTWVGDGYSVRSPIVVRPVALRAPLEVNDSYSVTFGYDGSFSATPRGLVPAAVTNGSVSDDPTDGPCSLTSPNAQQITVEVPADTTYARFSLFDADVAPGSDIDLCVFRGGTLVGSSGSGTSAEVVNLLNPVAGTYTVVVQGWGVVGTSPFALHTWLLGSADAGNMIVTAPTVATTGTTATVELSFVGLSAGTKYLGSVVYGGSASLPNPTIVRVDVP
jgi:subtilisin family serine protease